MLDRATTANHEHLMREQSSICQSWPGGQLSLLSTKHFANQSNQVRSYTPYSLMSGKRLFYSYSFQINQTPNMSCNVGERLAPGAVWFGDHGGLPSVTIVTDTGM